MADNNFGVLSKTLISAQNVLPELVAERPALSRFTSSFSNQVKNQGDTVKVKVPASRSAEVFDGVSFDTGQAIVMSDVNVSLDYHLFNLVKLTGNDLSNGAIELKNPIIKGCINSVLAGAYQKIFEGLKTSGAGKNIATWSKVTAANFDRSAVGALSTICANKKLGTDRFLIVAPEYHARLMADLSIVGISYNGQAGSAISTGKLTTPVDGFAVEQYVELQNTGTPNFIQGIFGHTSGLAIASAIPFAPSQVQTEIVTDLLTGLSIQLRFWSNGTTNTDYFSAHVLFGTKLVDANRVFAVVNDDPVA